MRANARATASSEAGRSTEKSSTPPCTSASAARSSRSAARPLLNWWLTSTPSHAKLPREAERSLAIATASKPQERRGEQRRAGDDRSDRDVAVDRAGAVQRREAGVERAPRHAPGKARDLRGAGDRRGVSDREELELAARRAHDLERHRGVLAAADGDEHAPRILRRARASAGGARGAEARAGQALEPVRRTRARRAPPSRAPRAAPRSRARAGRSRTRPTRAARS